MPPVIRIAPHVADALAAKRPVVALESTLVTHGLPHPEGVEAAIELEGEVRTNGATPATIGILDGAVHVGLNRSSLDWLAAAGEVQKLNLSNLAAGVTSGAPGSTTVAATMFIAAHVGIGVFATGGIGGVHRGSERSGDVSADLTALSRYPVAVVCSGAKAVLDLPRTVEMLETLGVPIIGFGTDSFPAFYRRESGLRVDRRVDTIEDLARVIRMHVSLGVGGGALVANPIPAEHELPREVYDRALRAALAEADREGVQGREVTPFLLDRLRVLTDGASVASNRALLRNNAAVAARLAAALAG